MVYWCRHHGRPGYVGHVASPLFVDRVGDGILDNLLTMIYVIAKRVSGTYPNTNLRLLVFALQGGAAAFKVEVEGYQVPEDMRVGEVTAFTDKVVEDPSYIEVEGCDSDSENGGQ